MQTCAQAQEALETYFAQWIQDLEPVVSEFGPEGATLDIPITDHVTRFGGIISGQALAALADTAMVFACAGHFGAFKPVATTNLDTQFLRPGSGDMIRCRARVVRAGKSLVFAEAEMTSLPSDKAVARATATFFLPS